GSRVCYELSVLAPVFAGTWGPVYVLTRPLPCATIWASARQRGRWTTMSREGLLQRLDAIGRSLEGTGNALALLALGSVGTELDRIDAYSDLDFFVVVRDGYRQAYLGDLGWLSSVHP